MKKIILAVILSTFSLKAFSFDLQDYERKIAERNKEALIVSSIISNTPSWDKKTKARVEKYAPVIIKVAKQLDMNPELLLAVSWAESHFNPKAESSVGALGLMQVKNETKEYIFKKNKIHRLIFTSMISSCEDLKSLENIIAGALYVKYLLKKFKGNQQRAIVAYNEGPTGTWRLVKKNYELRKHLYFVKVSSNLEKMSFNIKTKSLPVLAKN